MYCLLISLSIKWNSIRLGGEISKNAELSVVEVDLYNYSNLQNSSLSIWETDCQHFGSFIVTFISEAADELSDKNHSSVVILQSCLEILFFESHCIICFFYNTICCCQKEMTHRSKYKIYQSIGLAHLKLVEMPKLGMKCSLWPCSVWRVGGEWLSGIYPSKSNAEFKKILRWAESFLLAQFLRLFLNCAPPNMQIIFFYTHRLLTYIWNGSWKGVKYLLSIGAL